MPILGRPHNKALPSPPGRRTGSGFPHEHGGMAEHLESRSWPIGAFDGISVEIIHPEIVSLRLSWGQLLVDRERFTILATQEPAVRVQDFFVKCFQVLPETPIRAVGLNHEVQFPVASESARDRVGDVLAPKQFWRDFVTKDGAKAGGLRSLIMEQSISVDGRLTRLDGLKGWIQVRVEPSRHPELRYGVLVSVNDHYDLVEHNRIGDGRSAAELAADRWGMSITQSERHIDRIMELADGT
jgi:hypothetical protein